MPVQESPWPTFMEGSQLTAALKTALMATPAPGWVGGCYFSFFVSAGGGLFLVKFIYVAVQVLRS